MDDRHLAALGLRLRPERPDDQAFARALYASTRTYELSLVDWTDAQKHAFVAMQFNAQRASYRALYPDASFDIVVIDQIDERPIGRLYVHRSADEVRLLDITIDAGDRGRGFGSALIKTLLDEAAESGRALSLHVERHNPAMRLYLRLGFRLVEDGPVYSRLESRPGLDEVSSARLS